MTQAQRVDVRAQIASAAGASAGNVSKVKELAITAHPDVLAAIHNDELSIHRAWTWCKRSPRAQLQALWDYRAQKGVNLIIVMPHTFGRHLDFKPHLHILILPLVEVPG